VDVLGFHLSLHQEVYRPGDDTLLLGRIVASEVKPGERFLEVGCGSGLVSLVAARARALVTCTDLNPYAVAAARHNAQQNQLSIEVREGDLLAGAKGPFDVVAFNPPYLPTAPGEKLPGPLNLAFDGGPTGTDTVLRFVEQLAALPSLPRCVLVVHSSLADAKPLVDSLLRLGYRHDVAARETHFYEVIQVERFRKA
jgi:release factor glutamine methyltransferase